MSILNQSDAMFQISGLRTQARRDFKNIMNPLNSTLNSIDSSMGRLDNSPLFDSLNRNIVDLGSSIRGTSGPGGSETLLRSSISELNTDLSSLIRNLNTSIGQLSSSVGNINTGGGVNNVPPSTPTPSPRPIPPSQSNDGGGRGGLGMLASLGMARGGGLLGGLGVMSLIGEIKDAFSRGNELEEKFSMPNRELMLRTGMNLSESLKYVQGITQSFDKRAPKMTNAPSILGINPSKFSTAEMIEGTSKALDMGIRKSAMLEASAIGFTISKKIMPEVDLATSEFFKSYISVLSRGNDANALRDGVQQMAFIMNKTSQEFGVGADVLMGYVDEYSDTMMINAKTTSDINKSQGKVLKGALIMEKSGLGKEFFAQQRKSAWSALGGEGLKRDVILTEAYNRATGAGLDISSYRRLNRDNPAKQAEVNTIAAQQYMKELLKNRNWAELSNMEQEVAITQAENQGFGAEIEKLISSTAKIKDSSGKELPSDIQKALDLGKQFDENISKPYVDSTNALNASMKALEEAVKNNVLTPVSEQYSNAVSNKIYSSPIMQKANEWAMNNFGVTAPEAIVGTIGASLLAVWGGKKLFGMFGSAGAGAGAGAGAEAGSGWFSRAKGALGKAKGNLGAGYDLYREAGSGRISSAIKGTRDAISGGLFKGGISAGTGAGASAGAGVLKGALKKVPILGMLIGGGMLVNDVMNAKEGKKAETAVKGGGGLAGGLAGGALGASLGTMVLPGIGTAIGGILGGVAGAVFGEKFSGYIYDNFGGILDTFKGWGKTLSDIFSPIWASFKQIFVDMKPAWENLKTSFSGLLEGLKPVGELLMYIGGGALAGAVALLVGTFKGIAQAIEPLMGALSSLFNFWKDSIGVVTDLLTGNFSGAWEHLKNIPNDIFGIFKGSFGAIYKFVEGFCTGIYDFFASLYDKLVGHSIIPDMVNDIFGWFTNMGEWVGGAVKGLTSSIGNFFTDAWNTVSGAWSGVSTWFSSNVITPITGIFSGIGTTLSSTWTSVVEGFKGAWVGVTKWIDDTVIIPIKNLFQNLVDMVKGIPDMIFNAGKGIKDSVVGGVSGAWNSVTSWMGFASGISNVPADGFPAILHKGEMVLPAPQANWLRSALGQPTKPETSVSGEKGSHNQLVQSLPTYASGIDYVGGFLPNPVKGANLTDSFGNPRTAEATGGTGGHQGMDIFADKGTPITAVFDGKVANSGWNKVGGWRVGILDDKNTYWYYAHMDADPSKTTPEGTVIKSGTQIGVVGDSGDAKGTPPHLHFGIQAPYNGGNSAWVNPFLYLSNDAVASRKALRDGSVSDAVGGIVAEIQNQKGINSKFLSENIELKARKYYMEQWTKGLISMSEVTTKIAEAVAKGALPEQASSVTAQTGVAPSVSGINPSRTDAINYISNKATSMGIPAQIALATAWTESGLTQFKNGSVFTAGPADNLDYGLMQLNKRSWSKDYAWDKVSNDWQYNVDSGLNILKNRYNEAVRLGLDPARGSYSGYNTWSNLDRYATENDARDANFYRHYTSSPWTKLAMGGEIDSPIMAMMGEEAPTYKEYVIPTNPAYKSRAVALLQKASEDVGVSVSGGLSGGLNISVDTDSEEVVANLQTIASKLDELLQVFKQSGKSGNTTERAPKANSMSIRNFI